MKSNILILLLISQSTLSQLAKKNTGLINGCKAELSGF
jgi:hypothetical protein